MVRLIFLKVMLFAALALGLSVANYAATTNVGELAYCPVCPPPPDCDEEGCEGDDDDE